MGDWLSDSELEQILKIGWTLAAGRDEKELSAAAVREMLSFVGADEVDYNAVDLKTKPRTGRYFRSLKWLPESSGSWPVLLPSTRSSGISNAAITYFRYG
jgi:hypothetical protein